MELILCGVNMIWSENIMLVTTVSIACGQDRWRGQRVKREREREREREGWKTDKGWNCFLFCIQLRDITLHTT